MTGTVELVGSGIGGSASLEDSSAAYAELLRAVAAREIGLNVEVVPLSQVEQAWRRAGRERRVVFVP